MWLALADWQERFSLHLQVNCPGSDSDRSSVMSSPSLLITALMCACET